MIRPLLVRQTCSACPAQWEGTLDDGRMFYVRYRWGWLDIRVSPEKTQDVFEAVRGQSVLEQRLGDNRDGYLSLRDLKTATIGVIDWSHAKEADEITERDKVGGWGPDPSRDRGKVEGSGPARSQRGKVGAEPADAPGAKARRERNGKAKETE